MDENREFTELDDENPIEEPRCPEGMRVCALCGAYFTPSRTNQKYCEACRGKHNNARMARKIDAAVERKSDQYSSFLPKKLYDVVCKNCGKTFVYPYQDRKEYCSAYCRTEYIRKTAVCTCCGKNLREAGIEVDPDKYGIGKYCFCSPECKRTFCLERGYVHICKYCGKEYNTFDGKGGEIYCSSECHVKDRQKNMKKEKEPVTRVCPVCRKEFTTTGNAKLCSPECRQEHRKQLSSPDSKDTLLVPRVCTVCGKTFKGWKHQKFCSDECRDAYAGTLKKTKKPEKPKKQSRPKAAAGRDIDTEYVRKNGLCSICKTAYSDCIRMSSRFVYSPEGANFKNGVIVECPIFR